MDNQNGAIDTPDRQLTLQDLMSLANKEFKVNIPGFGFVLIRRPTGNDQSIAMAGSNNMDDPIRYQNILVCRCVTNPKMSEEDVKKLPSGITTLILKQLIGLTEQFSKSDFLEK